MRRFRGAVQAEPLATEVNEFAVCVDQSGLYDFYLDIELADNESLVHNNAASITRRHQIVTSQLESVRHMSQTFTDFSGSGLDRSWSVGAVSVRRKRREPPVSETTANLDTTACPLDLQHEPIT